MYPDKFINNPIDIPDTEHWAIIVQESVHIPGDERSRTNPGHGYPAETRSFVGYHMYLTEDKLLQAVKEMEEQDKRYYNKNVYKVIKVTPMKVSTTISIKVV